jgi:hypothetical protein
MAYFKIRFQFHFTETDEKKLKNHNFIFIIILGGVGVSSLVTAATTSLFYQPHIIDDGNCGATGGMTGEIEVLGKYLPPVLLCPPQIPYDPARA